MINSEKTAGENIERIVVKARLTDEGAIEEVHVDENQEEEENIREGLEEVDKEALLKIMKARKRRVGELNTGMADTPLCVRFAVLSAPFCFMFALLLLCAVCFFYLTFRSL